MEKQKNFVTPLIGFVSTALLARMIKLRSSRHASSRSCSHTGLSTPVDIPESLSESYSLLPREVEELRSCYISKSCSVSYANSVSLHIHLGRKSRLIDVYGHSYLDTRNNVAHCGHNHPEIIRAASYQMSQINTNTRYLHPNASLLAKKLVDLFSPSPLEVVFFVNSGSEANDLALRLARAYKVHTLQAKDATTCIRPHVIAIDKAYHGHTMATLNVSPYKYDQGDEFTNYPDYVTIVPCPDTYRGKHSIDKSKDSNNQCDSECSREEEAAKAYAAYVEKACDKITSEGKLLGAFIMEGGMSVGGVILPPKSYLQRCVKAVRDAGGLYIADEVQTGFGRLGKCMWAYQYSFAGENNDTELTPDIVTVGKPFGNGFPLAAVVTTRDIASAFKSLGVEYFNTFAGNPVSCSAGLAMLHILSSEKLQENALQAGIYLRQLFEEIQQRREIIGDIRGSGLFLGIELVKDRETKAPAMEETSFICSVLKEKYRILTSVDGPGDNVIVIKPPMCFSKEDALYFVRSFERVVVEDLPLAKDQLGKMGKTPT